MRRSLLIVLTALVALSTVAGLLCWPIDDYDDPALLMGARMMRAGFLPYVDFYTHYGPMGYTIQNVFAGFIESPSVALRVCQASFFCLLCVLALSMAGRLDPRSRAWPATIAILILLSALAPLASFSGLALVLTAVAAASMRGSPDRPSDLAWTVLAGAALTATFLTRPAFAFYGASAIAAVTLATEARKGSALRWLALGLAALGTLVAVWMTCYRSISPTAAIHATLLFPSRLSSSGARYKEGPFVRAPMPLAVAFGLILGAFQLAWISGLRDRKANSLAAVAIGLSGLCPLILRSSERPARDATLIAILVLLIGIFVVVVSRSPLSGDARLRAAALLGTGSTAFGHYFWTRQDRPHILPMVSLGVMAAALSAVRSSSRARWVTATVFGVGFLVLVPLGGLLPIERLWTGGLGEIATRSGRTNALPASIWPCGDLPRDAVAAVRAADDRADPRSRFVAVASNQSRTEQNPVLLFLISKRLPYTRWYSYDPGVQSSPEVQAEMMTELRRSGSDSAVVWRAEAFEATTPVGAGISTLSPFDRQFRALYPSAIALYGSYELRVSEGPR